MIRTRRRHLFALVTAMTMGAAALAACGDSEPDAADAASPGSTAAASEAPSTPEGASTPTTAEPDPTVTLHFLSYNYGTPDVGGQGTQELLDAFAAAHPNITIEPENAPVAEIATRAKAATAAGRPPDVVQIGWSKLSGALQSLPVAPIADLASPEKVQAATAGIEPAALAAGTVDGTLTVMPYAMSTPTVFYNADLFRAAGLDPEAPPTTWADVKQAALAIKDTGAGEGVYVGVANSGKSDFLTQSLINSNGGSLVGPDGQLGMEDPATVEALAMVADLTKSGAQPGIADDDALALFKTGRLGMYVTSTAVLRALDAAAEGAFELRTAPLPTYGELPARPTYSGSGLMVLGDDAEKNTAAWTFVEFMTSAEAFTILTEKIGYLPLRPDIVDDPNYLGPYFEDDGRILPALEQLHDAVPYQAFPGSHADEARVVLQDEVIAPIVLQGADPAPLLADAGKRIADLVAEG